MQPARAIAMGMLVILISAGVAASQGQDRRERTAELQRLLNGAGYNAGVADGLWGRNTAGAYTEFAEAAGGDVPRPGGGTPTAAGLKRMTGAVAAFLDADRRTYPTDTLPEGYFAGVGSQWFVNPHNWRNSAIAPGDGSSVRLTKDRWFEIIDSDLEAYRSAGISTIRLNFNVDGALFWQECNYRIDGDYDGRNACYDDAYAAAHADGWVRQRAALGTLAETPLVVMLTDAIAYLNDSGFHVILSPADFFWGDGGNWIDNPGDPLLHQYIQNDPAFQDFYPDWIAALIGAVRDRGLTGVSLQSMNEPRWCGSFGNLSGQRARWERVEREIFDAARRVAPHMTMIGTAICTAGDKYLSQTRRFDRIDRLLPRHDIGNVIYALHMRNPRILHISYNEDMPSSTVIHYPYQRLDPAIAGRHSTRVGIENYNAARPDRAFYDKMFAAMERVAAARKTRLMVTEFSVGKPAFGVPREDRVALVRDVLTAGRAYGVPVLYHSVLGEDGLSSNPHNIRIADHRFDADLLDLFARANALAE